MCHTSTQNELFKEQVDQVLGNDFRDGLRRHQEKGGQRRQGQGQGGQGQGGDSSGDIMGIPGEWNNQMYCMSHWLTAAIYVSDMGILTGLKGMGEGMKKQLNQLALNFNNSSGRGGSGARTRLDEEVRPLTAQENYEEVSHVCVLSIFLSNVFHVVFAALCGRRTRRMRTTTGDTTIVERRRTNSSAII